MSVSTCVKAFILSVLCGNPILKGAFVTILNSLLLKISFDIDQITLLIGRLNVHNQILSLGLNTINALTDKVSADLNLFLGPLQQFHDCAPMQAINELLQAPAVGKNIKALQKKISDLNRSTNLINIQNAIKQRKEDEQEKIQDFIDEIFSLCS